MRERADAADRHRRLKEIVLAADGLVGDERERFLDAECAGDAELERAARDVLGGGAVSTSDVVPAGAARTDDETTPARLGPFRIVREIGRGGMGVVYEALDERDGARIAVKAIHAHLLGNARAQVRFAREAAAGAQVVHPNVVRTIGAQRVEVDAGPARSVLVTELVAGRTLRELLRSLGRVPESLLREIARGMAHGVAAIHAAGIVHRDLKPENVMLTTDARVRVMDLGVARLLDSGDGLTREGDFVGSIEYAAPEQFGGLAPRSATSEASSAKGVDEVDGRADLYAVGVVLHELAGGANPFARTTSLATVAAHLTHVPPPIEASEFLAAVVAKLLAKDPTARFASAEELARVLDEAEDGAWWSGRAPRTGPRASTARNVPVTRGLALRGRARELATLRDAFASACGGRGTTVLLTGEPGLGKSRLIDEFLRATDAAGVHVAYGAIPPTGGPSGMTDALLAVLGGSDAVAWLTSSAGMAPPFAASLAAYLRREPPPGGSPSLAADAVQMALRRALQVRARERPVVLAVDDVHDAGPETGALLVSLARGLVDDRVLFVLAGRPDPRPRWVEDLATLPAFRAAVLSRLSSDDVAEILHEALGSEDLALRAARRIAAKSGGVPLYVAAMVGALRDALAASSGEGRAGAIERIDVPMELRGAVAARLAGLSADERTCLDVCAVQGVVFDAEIAATATETPLVRMLQILAEVERRGGLVRADGRRFRFDHQLVADAVDESLPPRLREEYHLRTARALAARGKSAPETLARHFVESSEPALAVPHLLPAIEALAARHENDAALRLAVRALDVRGLLAGAPRAEALLRVAHLHHVAWRRAEHAQAAAEALAIARETRDLRLVGHALAAVGRRVTDADESKRALPLLRGAIRIARRIGDRRLEVKASEALGAALVTLGRVDEARTHLATARGLAVAAGDPTAEHLARRGLGVLELGAGRYDDARVEFERCLELARTLGSPRAEGHAEWGLGVVDVNAGLWDSARARFARARDAGRAVGDRSLEINALGNFAVCGHAAGRWTDVVATLRELRTVVEEAGERTGLSLMLVHLSQAWSCLGDPDAARAALDEAESIARAVGFKRTLAQVEFCRGEAALDAGDLARARERLRRADEEMIAAGHTSGRVDALLLLATIARETGDADEALRCVDAAGAIAASLARPSSRMLVAAARATLPGGDAAAARAIVDEVGPRAMVSIRMRARFDLFLAAGDARDLDEARRLLAEVMVLVPPERRRASVENIKLHREVAAACARAGLPSPV